MGHVLNARGKPTFQATPTQTVADLQAATDFADTVGAGMRGTSAERNLLTSAGIELGQFFTEVDTGRIYVWLSGGFQTVFIPDTGWKELGALGAGWTSVVDPRYRVKNGWASLTGRVNAASNGAGFMLVQSLPEEARPSTDHTVRMTTQSGTDNIAVIQPSGTIFVYHGGITDAFLSSIPPWPVG